jgi:hypothetical protein
MRLSAEGRYGIYTGSAITKLWRFRHCALMTFGPERVKPLVTALAGLATALACVAATTSFNFNPPTPSPLGGHSPATAPTLSITRDGPNVSLVFTGTLQRAEAITGPWTNVSNATNPYQPTFGSTAFYRTRTSDSIFNTNAVVELTLVAPFQKNFELAHAGEPDGIFPPVRQKPYFDGTLHLTNLDLPVSLRVRGNSSLQECPFPKLKFKVDKETRPGTPFFDAREVKLGTHCAEGGRGTIGRLREQAAAYREALAYETMDLLGFTSPRVRRARVHYVDITPTNSSPAGGWQVTRDGILLDDIEVVGQRLGGRSLDDEELEALKDANFDPQLITDLKFLHALLGNWDYKLSVDGVGLWNIDVIELTNRTLVPVAGDFDLASWVTGVVRVMAPREYRPDLPDIERQPLFELERIKQQVAPTHFAAARQRFEAARNAIEAQINVALLDGPGRTNTQQHVTAFYGALSSTTR